MLETRLVVEAECKMKLERCLAFLSSFSFSLVTRDEVETIDRRFTMLRSMPPSSAFSFSSSPDEDELEEMGKGAYGVLMVVPEIDDSWDDEADESKVASES